MRVPLDGVQAEAASRPCAAAAEPHGRMAACSGERAAPCCAGAMGWMMVRWACFRGGRQEPWQAPRSSSTARAAACSACHRASSRSPHSRGSRSPPARPLVACKGSCVVTLRAARLVDSSTRHVELRVEAGRLEIDRRESGARAGAGGAWDVAPVRTRRVVLGRSGIISKVEGSNTKGFSTRFNRRRRMALSQPFLQFDTL